MEDGLHTAASSELSEGGRLGRQDGPLPLGPADQAQIRCSPMRSEHLCQCFRVFHGLAPIALVYVEHDHTLDLSGLPSSLRSIMHILDDHDNCHPACHNHNLGFTRII